MIFLSVKEILFNKLSSVYDRVGKTTPVIYFLLNNGKIVYVGSSKKVKTRVKTHISRGLKVFDDFIIEETNDEEMKQKEKEYIEKHKPKYNKIYNEDSTINQKKEVGNLFHSIEVAEFFGIPKPTMANWSKEKDTWRAKLYRKLEKDYAEYLAKQARDMK